MNGIDTRILELAKQTGLIQYDSDAKIDNVRMFAEELLVMAANMIENWDHGVYSPDHNGIRLIKAFKIPYKIVKGEVDLNKVPWNVI